MIYGTDQTLPSSSMTSSDFSVDDHISSMASSYDSDDEYQLAQREWEESLGQLQQLVATVLLPFFGKWLGRRWSHIGSFLLRRGLLLGGLTQAISVCPIFACRLG